MKGVPAYCLNPNEKSIGLSLNIDENNKALGLDLALSKAPYFGLPLKAASNFIMLHVKLLKPGVIRPTGWVSRKWNRR